MANSPRLPYYAGEEANTYLDAEVARVDDDGKTILRQRGGAVLLDLNGNPFSDENRIPVDVGGATLNIQGDVLVEFDSHVSTLNTTTTPLGANEVFTGGWEACVDYAAICASIKTDAGSAPTGAIVQYSSDGTDDGLITQETATIYANVPVFFTFTPQAAYFRIKYTNGPVAQTDLDCQVILANQAIVPQSPLAAQSDDLSPSLSVQSHLKARISSGPYTGAWNPLSMNPANGRLLVETIPDEAGLTDAELRAAPVPVDTGLDIPQPQTDALTNVELRAAPVSVTPTADPSSAFKKLAKAEPLDGEEIRFDDVSGGDLYLGAAPDGTAEGSTTWKVVRYYRTATGSITRMRFRTGVAWSARTAGW